MLSKINLVLVTNMIGPVFNSIKYMMSFKIPNRIAGKRVPSIIPMIIESFLNLSIILPIFLMNLSDYVQSCQIVPVERIRSYW